MEEKTRDEANKKTIDNDDPSFPLPFKVVPLNQEMASLLIGY